jgi:hypothetical protein
VAALRCFQAQLIASLHFANELLATCLDHKIRLIGIAGVIFNLELGAAAFQSFLNGAFIVYENGEAPFLDGHLPFHKPRSKSTGEDCDDNECGRHRRRRCQCQNAARSCDRSPHGEMELVGTIRIAMLVGVERA